MGSVRAVAPGFLLAVGLGVLTSCAAFGPGAPLPEVDLDDPAWTVATGQALWKRQAEAPPLAGELLVARNPRGEVLVSFSKPPLPLFTAQTSEGRWRIDFVDRGRAFGGRGRPPKRFVWFDLPRLLLDGSSTPPARWRVERRGGDELELTHPRGETIRLVMDP